MEEPIGIMRERPITRWQPGALFACLGGLLLAGCYADRLPEPVKHLGVPRIEAIEIEPLEPVSLKPGETATVTVRLKRNGNEGPIAVSLSKLPSGVELTHDKEIAADKSEAAISLVGSPALGDKTEQFTVTVTLTMAGETLEPTFSLTLPQVSRPVITTLPPVFLQPGDAIDLLVPIERNGYGEPLTLEPIEMPEGIVCTIPEKPIEDNSLPIHLAAADDAAEGRLAPLLKTTVFGREVSAPLTVMVTRHPFTLPEIPVVQVAPGQTREVELAIERDSLESLSRLMTGGLQALTGVQLAPESFNGLIFLAATSPDEAISIDPAEVAEGSSHSRLTVKVADTAQPGAVSISLLATANHLEAQGLLVVRVADTETAGGELPEPIVDAIAPPKRLRPGGVAGRSTAEAKQLFGRFYGQTPQSQQAIGKALEWLAAAQADDGSWQSGNNQAQATTAVLPIDGSGVTADVATTTATALLPFLAEGVTHEPESAESLWLEAYPEVVQKGLLWLGNRQIEASQQVPGLISESLAGQSLGLTAFSETLALSGDRRLTQNAKLAAKQLADQQADDGGWPQGDTITSLATARAVLALEAAKACGVGVSAGNLRRAEKYLEQAGVGGDQTPRAAYAAEPGGPPDPTATAACLLAWQYAELPQDTPDLLAAADHLASLAPRLEDEGFNQPIDFLLFAGDLLRNLEGDRYDRWNAQVRSFLCRTQEQEGDNTGSWNPDIFAGGRDRVSTTALATLCLQAAYRTLPAYRQ